MLRENLPEYSEVHVVSDLHLGGFDGEPGVGGRRRDCRIFRETEALSGWVNWLTGQKSPEGPVALVLNGDIVDFLADENATYFDWARALDKLRTAMSDEKQSAVWESLRTFVKSGRGDLVLVLGNHDLELALADTQEHLRQYLTSGDSKRRGAVVFATDGAGFRCRVGNARVLCLHGNEADPWNAVDYGRLSLIRRALARGSFDRYRAVLREWIPNAGTQMVIEYMNGVKRRYQWVDLLKPEVEAAAMVTAALAKLPGLRTFAEVASRKSEAQRRLKDGFLTAQTLDFTDDEENAGRGTPAPRTKRDARQLLLDTMDALARDTASVDLIEDQDFLMTTAERVTTGLFVKKWPRALRDVLRYSLAGDNGFAPSTKDDTYAELDELCSGDWDFLIAGHTHLHRALERDRQRGRFYFNSGTWIQLVHIPLAALDGSAYPELERRLQDGSMDELEEELPTPSGPVSLLRTTRTVVTIDRHQGQTRGRLTVVPPDGPEWRPVDVADTTFTVRA